MITTGTDTMEEVAVLCALMYDGDAPIVVTGANRPGSSPGADGPANLLDAVVLAGTPIAAGLGVVIAFGGEIHAAMTVRKIDSTGPTAFGSPTAGPLGRIVERRVWLHALPIRHTPLAVARLEHRVMVVGTGLGDDGSLLRHADEIKRRLRRCGARRRPPSAGGAARATQRDRNAAGRDHLPAGPVLDAVLHVWA